jgi:hypothetical protein
MSEFVLKLEEDYALDRYDAASRGYEWFRDTAGR